MIKKTLIVVLFFVSFAGVGLFMNQPAAHAATPWQIDFWNHFCSVGTWGGCKGYFTNQKPGCIPNICNDYNVLSTPVNVGGAATGCGGGSACAAFISIYQGYLYSGGPGQNTCGAAFVINAMMGRGASSSGCGAGINAAKSSFNAWVALVQSYASSGNPAYGVQWNTLQNPTVNSSWFANNGGYPNNISDDISHANIWACTVDGCGGAYRDDATTGWVWKTVNVPIAVIRFYFPGGSFMIQRGCSNLVGNSPKLPTINQPPTGTISLSCNMALQQQVATISFRDPDGSTTGYVKTGGWTSGTYNSPGPATVTIPQSATNPYTPQGVALFVKDTGPGGTGAYQQVATASTAVPCVQLACGSMTVTPSRIDPYNTFSVAASVTNGVNQTPPNATMKLQITPPAGATYTYTGTQNAGGSGSVSTATFSGVGPTNNAGVFTATWTLQWSSGSKTCSSTFPVIYLPYMSVYGGDVTVGASPDYTNGACSMDVDARAGIYSWNNHATNFSGAGTQYAVQALAQIQDFASAQNSTNTTPAGLSIANYYNPANASQLNPSQGLFGGYAGATTNDCDFTSDLTTAPTTANMTIGATTVAVGAQDIRYVKNADVYINGNIVYAGSGGSWTNVGQIPFFKLVVVGGNIYIGSNVTQLDGLFVAEPIVGAGGVVSTNGNIYTCASGFGAQANPMLPGYYAQCNKQLTVNGAFVADQVHFLRTYGSVGQAQITDTPAASHAGEAINYTPELWLPRGGSVAAGNYNAITGLPPVL
ncbi:MAG TPA: hypothetical protein VFT53_01910 [Candidatus Saccharimonadales bacterium]|nr:hypothetical protein [Candidatus Saccharimonadales bacterium]